MTTSDILAVCALFFSGTSVLFAVMGWRKNRTIYGFKRYPLRMPTGKDGDTAINMVDKMINHELESGKWTVIDIVQRPSDGDYDLILGKVKE